MLNEKLKKLNIVDVGDEELVTGRDFAQIMNALIDNINTFREQINKKGDSTNEDVKYLDDKLEKFIETTKKQFKDIGELSASKLNTLKLEINQSIDRLQESIDEIEFKQGEPGADGEDAEITDELKQELIDKILIEFKKQNDPIFKKEVQEAVDKAIKEIKPQVIVQQDGGYGAPFEIPIKGGTNVTVRKDASGAYVISAIGGSTDTFADNEIATGSGTAFAIANTPILGSEHVFANGQRLIPTVDYTISGKNITTSLSWDAGVVLVDYRY